MLGHIPQPAHEIRVVVVQLQNKFQERQISGTLFFVCGLAVQQRREMLANQPPDLNVSPGLFRAFSVSVAFRLHQLLTP